MDNRPNLSIEAVDPAAPAVLALVAALDELQKSLYDEDSNHLDPPSALATPNAHFLGAFEGETLLGCGAVKVLESPDEGLYYGEIKRMFVSPAARGKGVAKALMEQLEIRARGSGAVVLRLETGIYQPEAIGLYERWGFVRRGPFAGYGPDPVSVFMEKPL